MAPPTNLNTLEGYLELEWVEEGTGVIQNYYIADMHLGHPSENN